MAATLKPKPANFSDAKHMATIDVATRMKAVAEERAAVGASAQMPPFKTLLNPQQLQDVVAFAGTLAHAAPEAAGASPESAAIPRTADFYLLLFGLALMPTMLVLWMAATRYHDSLS
jgi:mono/diheme cytochrome c family protein